MYDGPERPVPNARFSLTSSPSAALSQGASLQPGSLSTQGMSLSTQTEDDVVQYIRPDPLDGIHRYEFYLYGIAPAPVVAGLFARTPVCASTGPAVPAVYCLLARLTQRARAAGVSTDTNWSFYRYKQSQPMT